MDWKETVMSVLNEGKSVQIYCDLDGVLCDFEKGIETAANELMNRVRTNKEHYESQEANRKSHDYMVWKHTSKVAEQLGGWDKKVVFNDFADRSGGKAVSNMMYWYISKSRKWWANLEWAPGGQELWTAIAPHNPIILTAPVGPRSVEGKKDWCKANLGLSGGKVIVIQDKGIKLSGPSVLIDDKDKYINQFKSSGGMGVLHVTGHSGPTIARLKGVLK